MFRSANGFRILIGGMFLLAAASVGSAAEKQPYGYGTPATPEQIAGWNIDTRGDDGAGLPPGEGNVNRGSEVFTDQCAS